MSNKPYICQYCGLNCHPDAYHEGAEACQAAMRRLTAELRTFFRTVSPFISCWELEPWNMDSDGEMTFASLAFQVGHGEGFPDPPFLIDPAAADVALAVKLKAEKNNAMP